MSPCTTSPGPMSTNNWTKVKEVNQGNSLWRFACANVCSSNTLAPWKQPAWWWRRQLYPTCQAGCLHAQQFQLVLDFHFHFLPLSVWSSWLLLSTWSSDLSQMWCCEVWWTGNNRPFNPSWPWLQILLTLLMWFCCLTCHMFCGHFGWGCWML